MYIKLLLLTLVCFFLKGTSQINESYKNYSFNNLPIAPTAKEFLRYGEVQNSEYTGTNAPEIPLLNVEEGDAKINLVLKYISGNGIKVTDEAGTVGLGWTIAIPTITQSVLGLSDFSGVASLKIDLSYNPDGTPFPLLNYNKKYYLKKAGDSVDAGFIKQPIRGKYSYFWSQDLSVPVAGYFKDINNETNYDTSPDIFSLNLFGEKILFIDENFETNTTPSITPHIFNFTALNNKGYKISYANDIFTVFSPNGNIYEFTEKEHIEWYGFAYNSKNFYITKISDKNNRSIRFTYDHYNVPLISKKNSNYNYTYGYVANYEATGGYGSIPLNPPAPAPSGHSQFDYAGTYIVDPPYAGGATSTFKEIVFPLYQFIIYNQPVIKSIISDFGKIEFIYSERNDYPTQKLDFIRLNDYNNNLVKQIIFGYDYFVGFTNINDDSSGYTDSRLKNRLKLKSVSTGGSLTDAKETYYFDYNPVSLPSKISNSVDYWGYYNGGNNNKTLFPNPNDFYIGYNIPINQLNNNKKNADIDFIKAGILQKITYPTGGYSKFEYELNTANNLFYSDWTHKLNSGNGLRLKNQVNYDNKNNKIGEVAFLYEGGMSMNPQIVLKDAVYNPVDISGCVYLSKLSNVIVMKSTNDNTPSPMSSGDILGYSKVTKIAKGNSISFKTETNFSNYLDPYYFFYKEQLPVQMPSIKSADTDNGKIINQTVFDSNNKKIQETYNTYVNSYSKTFYGTSLQKTSRFLFYCAMDQPGMSISQGKPGISIIGQFSIFDKESLLYSTKTTDYIADKQLSTSTSFFYNSNNLLTSKTTSFPDGHMVNEQIEYPKEKNHTRLIDANAISIPLKEVTINATGGLSKTLSSRETKYDSPDHLNPTSIISNELSVNMNQNTVVTFDRYDDKSNLIQYTGKNGIVTTIIWGYNQTKPIAKISGSTYAQSMQAFNLDPNDSNSYKQLAIVKKSNLDVNDVTENELISELLNFKSKPEFKNSQLTLYTHNPLVGVTNIIETSGIYKKYTYNIHNKLEKITNNDGKLIKEFKYNYAPLKYYNSLRSQMFYKNNCTSNSLASTYTYTVPEDTYSSLISQVDADQQAQNDININGQNMANSQGTCTTFSCGISLSFPGGGGISATSNGYYKATFGISTGADSASLPWSSTGVKVGTITGTCKPSQDYSSFDGTVYYTIKTNGDIIVRNSNAGYPNNSSASYQFIYPTN